jgi:hypothetical protein
MTAIVYILVGCGVGAAGAFAFLQLVHGARRKSDEQRYKDRWSSAVQLLHDRGQLTDAQLQLIRPPEEDRLPTGTGFSEDRAKVEIERAKAGLPPADNLKGMFSEDQARVKRARIKHGTAK